MKKVKEKIREISAKRGTRAFLDFYRFAVLGVSSFAVFCSLVDKGYWFLGLIIAPALIGEFRDFIKKASKWNG